MSSLPVEIWLDVLEFVVVPRRKYSTFFPPISDLKPIKGFGKANRFFRRIYNEFSAQRACVRVSPRRMVLDEKLAIINGVRLQRIKHLCFFDEDRIHNPKLPPETQEKIKATIDSCTNLKTLSIRMSGMVIGYKQILTSVYLSNLTTLEMPLDCVINPSEPLLDLPSVSSLQLFVRLAGTLSSEPVFLNQIRFHNYIGEYDGGETLVNLLVNRLEKLLALATLSIRLSLEEPFEAQMQLGYHKIEHWERNNAIGDCHVCTSRFKTNRRFVVFQENVATKQLAMARPGLQSVGWGDPWVEDWSKGDLCQRATSIIRKEDGEVVLKRDDGLIDDIWA